MCKIDWGLVIQGLSAVGTIAVAIIAVWGEWIKSAVVPPKLKIEIHNTKGQPGVTGREGIETYYYHLKVINTRRWAPSHNSRVVLTEYYKLLPDGKWQQFVMTVEPVFKWAPSDQTKMFETVHSQFVFDFVKLTRGKNFEPCLNRTFNDFNGNVTPNGAIRYGLRVISDEFEQRKAQIFQVTWNGGWPGEVESSVKIEEI